MKAGTLELPHGNWSRPHVHVLPEWQKALYLLEAIADRALQLTGVFLFEFDEHSEQSPLFILRAATGEFPRETRVPLDEATLTVLNQATGPPLIIEMSHPFGKLKPLVSFIARQGGVSALIAPVRHEERLLGCLVACATGHCCFTPAELSVFSLLASYAAVIMESARLRAETAFRLSEAMSLQAVSSALVEERSLDTVLAAIIDEASRLTDARDALVLLLEEGGDWFRVCARKGPGVAELTSGRLSVKDSLNGLVVTTGQPLGSHDAMTDPRANQARARRLNVRTVAIAPLRIRDRTIGTIALHNKRGGYFSRADIEALCSFANQAAIAIDNARLFGELLSAKDEIQQKAQELQELLVQTMSIQEDERCRIAADIHDRVVPLIVGALYEVEACAQICRRSEDSLEQLETVQRLLNDAVQEIRATIYDLWPATLDHIGLIPALRELLSHQEKASGIRHSLRVYGSPYELRSAARIAIYRIVQEALNNIRQHAAAGSVDMSIRFGPQRIRIIIQDDGKGFDIQSVMLSPPERHFGLIGMRERAVSVGGSLRIDSVPGEGSQVILDIAIGEAGIQEGSEWDDAPNSCADS